MQNIKPLKGKYLCEIISDIQQLPSGLFLAENTKDIPHKAKVLEAGGDYIDHKGKIIKQSAKKGDIIHFSRVWNRSPKDKSIIFIKEEEIEAVERN